MRILILIIFLSVVNGLKAQSFLIQDTLYANYLGQKQGLLQVNVKGMAQDDLGYLWAGTEDGLHRFNGYEFKPYLHNPTDSSSIKDDHVRGLLFTKDTLWIATNSKGINGFIPSKNKFFSTQYAIHNEALNTTYKVFELYPNALLFSTKNHIIVFNRITKASKIIPLPKSNTESYVTDILKVDEDTFWLGTSTSGVLQLKLSSLKISDLNIFKNERDICFYKQGEKIYIGTKSGLYIYDSITRNTIKSTFNDEMKCFYEVDPTRFYLGSKNGLFLFDSENNSITPIILKTDEDKTFKTIDINQITGDDKGNLWIGTDADGILHYNIYQKKFNTLKLTLDEYPQKSNISSFQYLKGKDSTLWIGTAFGIAKYNHRSNRFKLYKTKSPALIYTITKDANNNIWAGGFTSGLLKYDETNDRFKQINSTSKSLPDNDVIEIIPIDANTLWVCTWAGGIQKYNIATESFRELLIDGKRLNRARTSLIDSNGNIWLGTDQGAYKLATDNKVYKYHSNTEAANSLTSDRVFNIKEDNLGNIWIGTNAGLTKLDVNTDTTTLYYKQKGLPNDFIYSILITKDNLVWVSTNYGISVLNTQTHTFKNYTVSDGLQNNEFNGKAGYKDEFGNFYFGGISGINIFNPDEIVENPFVPDSYIESVELFNRPLLKNEMFRDSLHFKYDENVLTFNYSALSYLNPEKSNYSYKMDGFDADWRPSTKNRSTTYTNLDPGHYTFNVKASNDSGVWNNKPTSLHITIIPPWYKTTAFKIIAAIAALLFSVLFYKYKTYKLKNDKLKLEAVVNLRTQEIADKNKDLSFAYKEADRQRKNITFLMRELSHRVKNNLQIISSLLNIQANNLDNNPTASDALKVAKNRILTISHIENKLSDEKEHIAIDRFIEDISNSVIGALSDDEHLKFKVEYDLEHAQIKNINTTMLGLILNELITNTTKYAFDTYKPENLLKISCEVLDNSLKITVQDNGKGYVLDLSESKKSLGIELVTEMVDQLNGTIQINSTKGTVNVLEIPI